MAAATDNLGMKWSLHVKNGYDYWIDYKFDTTVPSVYKTYINNGRHEWNKPNREIFFNWDQNTEAHEAIVDYDDLWWPYNCSFGLTATYGFLLISSAEVTFNNNICDGDWWFSYGSGFLECNALDLWGATAHEWGRLVQLNHSSISSDTMYPNMQCGSTYFRSLTTHDINGIKAQYAAH